MVQREKGRKNSKRKQGTSTARGKRTGIWTEMEKKAAGIEEERQKKQGTLRIDQDSSRTEMAKKTWDGHQDTEE